MKKALLAISMFLLIGVSVVLSGCFPKPHNYVDSVTLNKTELTLTLGETFELIPTINPADAEDIDTLEWESENSNIVSVENGIVTAVALGEVEIYVYVGKANAHCKVTVVDKVYQVAGKSFVIEDLQYEFTADCTVNDDQREYLINNRQSRLNTYKSTNYQAMTLTFNLDGTFTKKYYLSNAYWTVYGTYQQNDGSISLSVTRTTYRDNQTGTPTEEIEYPFENTDAWSATTLGNKVTLTIDNNGYAGKGVNVIHIMTLAD